MGEAKLNGSWAAAPVPSTTAPGPRPGIAFRPNFSLNGKATIKLRKFLEPRPPGLRDFTLIFPREAQSAFNKQHRVSRELRAASQGLPRADIPATGAGLARLRKLRPARKQRPAGGRGRQVGGAGSHVARERRPQVLPRRGSRSHGAAVAPALRAAPARRLPRAQRPASAAGSQHLALSERDRSRCGAGRVVLRGAGPGAPGARPPAGSLPAAPPAGAPLALHRAPLRSLSVRPRACLACPGPPAGHRGLAASPRPRAPAVSPDLHLVTGCLLSASPPPS